MSAASVGAIATAAALAQMRTWDPAAIGCRSRRRREKMPLRTVILASLILNMIWHAGRPLRPKMCLGRRPCLPAPTTRRTPCTRQPGDSIFSAFQRMRLLHHPRPRLRALGWASRQMMPSIQTIHPAHLHRSTRQLHRPIPLLKASLADLARPPRCRGTRHRQRFLMSKGDPLLVGGQQDRTCGETRPLQSEACIEYRASRHPLTPQRPAQLGIRPATSDTLPAFRASRKGPTASRSVQISPGVTARHYADSPLRPGALDGDPLPSRPSRRQATAMPLWQPCPMPSRG